MLGGSASSGLAHRAHVWQTATSRPGRVGRPNKQAMQEVKLLWGELSFVLVRNLKERTSQRPRKGVIMSRFESLRQMGPLATLLDATSTHARGSVQVVQEDLLKMEILSEFHLYAKEGELVKKCAELMNIAIEDDSSSMKVFLAKFGQALKEFENAYGEQVGMQASELNIESIVEDIFQKERPQHTAEQLKKLDKDLQIQGIFSSVDEAIVSIAQLNLAQAVLLVHHSNQRVDGHLVTSINEAFNSCRNFYRYLMFLEPVSELEILVNGLEAANEARLQVAPPADLSLRMPSFLLLGLSQVYRNTSSPSVSAIF
ncbi:hypothetical protein T439DRAFT_351140 [Meredithblackwellia eburnea MCA 4105]